LFAEYGDDVVAVGQRLVLVGEVPQADEPTA
jgi:hypothetical protein